MYHTVCCYSYTHSTSACTHRTGTKLYGFIRTIRAQIWMMSLVEQSHKIMSPSERNTFIWILNSRIWSQFFLKWIFLRTCFTVFLTFPMHYKVTVVQTRTYMQFMHTIKVFQFFFTMPWCIFLLLFCWNSFRCIITIICLPLREVDSSSKQVL